MGQSHVRLQFVLGAGLASQAIAWFGAGHFSHVDYVLPDGRLLGARTDHPVDGKTGVQIRPANYEVWKERQVISIPCSQRSLNRYETFLRAQVGKPYDKTAIFGFVAGRDWRAPDSWFCSELQARAGEVAGLWPRLDTPVTKIMPGTLAIVSTAVGGCHSLAA
jgi:hypothetical protein